MQCAQIGIEKCQLSGQPSGQSGRSSSVSQNDRRKSTGKINRSSGRSSGHLANHRRHRARLASGQLAGLARLALSAGHNQQVNNRLARTRFNSSPSTGSRSTKSTINQVTTPRPRHRQVSQPSHQGLATIWPPVIAWHHHWPTLAINIAIVIDRSDPDKNVVDWLSSVVWSPSSTGNDRRSPSTGRHRQVTWQRQQVNWLTSTSPSGRRHRLATTGINRSTTTRQINNSTTTSGHRQVITSKFDIIPGHLDHRRQNVNNVNWHRLDLVLSTS